MPATVYDALNETEIGRQLILAGVAPYLSEVAAHTRDDGTIWLRALAHSGLLAHLETHALFLTGPGARLHPWVGKGRRDFRGIGDSFGEGSLQVVYSPVTGRVEADIDGHSPYDDGLGFFAHNFIVLRNWWRRLRG